MSIFKNQPAGSRVSTGRRFSRALGFTLVELLIVMGTIAILGSVAYVTVTNTRESTRVSKLESDVATINAAIQVYTVSGGSLPGTPTPDQVLAKLKTKASAATATGVPGLRSSFIDLRLATDMQSAAEGATGEQRALWDAAAGRFVVVTGGAAGVQNFVLDDALAAVGPGTEARAPTLKTTNKNWLWAYTDVAPTAPGAPAAPGTNVGVPGATPTVNAVLQLSPPDFSQDGGSSPLVNFDLSLSLSNPNPAGTSEIFYSIGGATAARYKGQTLTIAPGVTVSAYAATVDSDHWANSAVDVNTYTAQPVTLLVSLNVPQASLTYAQAGGAMATGTPQTPSPATITLDSAAQIPDRFETGAKFQVYHTYGAESDPLAGGTGGPFPGPYAPKTVDVSIGNWGSASSLVIKAAARALDTALFTSTPAAQVATGTITIAPTTLAAPVVDPVSGQKAAELPVSIVPAAGQPYPAGARIYYTLDGTDPGNSQGNPTGGTLYAGQFSSGAGTNGVVVVTARAYAPAAYAKWFTPSAAVITTYSTITTPEGALVGSANLNGTFVGSLVYALPPSGSMSNITFNSGSKILGGNLYLPGTPTIRLSNGTTWSAANDNLFANYIQGWEYSSAGAKTVQTTPRVINENGSATPNNYSVSFNNNAVLEGKVIRRHNSPAFPVITAPPAPDGSGNASLNSPPAGPLNSSQYANVTINSAGVGDVRLNAGHYGNLNANNNTAFVLGDPNHPEVTQVYSFQSLNLNSSSDLKIVGKVIITVGGTININNGSVLGDPNHPEWLQLQFSSGSLNANSGSAIYGQLVAPTSSVSFNAGSVFAGSVTAQSLTINSNSVVFNLPPVIQN